MFYQKRMFLLCRPKNMLKFSEAIKKVIIHITYLSIAKPRKPYRLYIDASDIAIGAVVNDDDENTGEKKIYLFCI